MTLITRRNSLALLGAGLATPLMSEPLSLDGLGNVIKGYDPVAYFRDEAAVKGSYEHELITDEGNWWFSSAENLSRFEDNPERYMPKYGGYCAEGIARGFKRRSDPTVWVLVRDKLYLHYSIEVQNRWADDVRGHINLADGNWPKLKDQA